MAVIGAEEATRAAIAWLIEVVASGREVATSLYYRDPLDLHLALTRALVVGVDALRPAIDVAAERARHRLREENLSPYRRAQAMIVAGASASPFLAEVSDAAARLVESANADGCWPAETLYVAGNTESAGLWHYQSWAVTTALCVRALASVASTKRG
ncbi:MAG: hypothetical protein VBE63_24685 [Lamprobacter sp.]|uniref:hypothetical protein n=1 Tax=Lamprobacter sp. TaxID=3100796 RepID=UPI002B25FF98|nr:hypothetical protein [Lamprobacter sp.]MEA3643111.1 hypothetical protein [Lamprobacter sp.]